MSKPPRLVRSDTIDIPIKEVSALAARRRGNQLRVIAVGDRTWHITGATYDPETGFTGWQKLDLSAVDGWPLPAGDSQLEAIAVDGGALVVLLREDPPVALVADTDAKQLLAEISLTAPTGSPLAGHWDDPSSRGEGLVLLRGGRLLVAKEKRPAALVEFGPVGSVAKGLSQDDFLVPEESWESPTGKVDYVATAMWTLDGEAKEALADLSALAVSRNRFLWLLSDKAGDQGRLSLKTPLSPDGGTIKQLDAVWRLPKKTKKPEGIVALDDHRVLVGMDTSSKHANAIIAEVSKK